MGAPDVNDGANVLNSVSINIYDNYEYKVVRKKFTSAGSSTRRPGDPVPQKRLLSLGGIALDPIDALQDVNQIEPIVLHSGTASSSHLFANVPVEPLRLCDLDPAAEKVLQVHEEPPHIEEASSRLHLHQEIEIAIVPLLPSRHRAEDPNVPRPVSRSYGEHFFP